MLDEGTRKTMETLARTEAKGLSMVIGFHGATRQYEMTRDPEGAGRLNGWKGYVPETQMDGVAVTIADASRHQELLIKGWVRIGEVTGDPDDAAGSNGTLSYYQSSVSGRTPFRQGIAQSVHATNRGVDARTGISRTGHTSGVITGAEARRVTQRRKASRRTGDRDARAPGEHLIPRFTADGNVHSYERPMQTRSRASRCPTTSGADRLSRRIRAREGLFIYMNEGRGVWSGHASGAAVDATQHAKPLPPFRPPPRSDATDKADFIINTSLRNSSYSARGPRAGH
ncbi:MAG: hypothetical protein R6V44_03295 [Paracoccaceae bacterium]